MSGLLIQGVPVRKRLFDLAVTAPGVVLISPMLIGIGLLVWMRMGRPVLFRQRRAGYRGEIFDVLKFRTMRRDRDVQGRLLPDEARLTELGRVLRALSLDELPELFNVIRGEMSLVGPRPLFARYLSRYTAEQARRHEVLPGITGWAQIHGRNVLRWEDKFELDVWYVDHWSLWLDVKILSITLWKVLRREGISQPGHATAPEFMGSRSTKQAEHAASMEPPSSDQGGQSGRV